MAETILPPSPEFSPHPSDIEIPEIGTPLSPAEIDGSISEAIALAQDIVQHNSTANYQDEAVYNRLKRIKAQHGEDSQRYQDAVRRQGVKETAQVEGNAKWQRGQAQEKLVDTVLKSDPDRIMAVLTYHLLYPAAAAESTAAVRLSNSAVAKRGAELRVSDITTNPDNRAALKAGLDDHDQLSGGRTRNRYPDRPDQQRALRLPNIYGIAGHAFSKAIRIEGRQAEDAARYDATKFGGAQTRAAERDAQKAIVLGYANAQQDVYLATEEALGARIADIKANGANAAVLEKLQEGLDIRQEHVEQHRRESDLAKNILSSMPLGELPDEGQVRAVEDHLRESLVSINAMRLTDPLRAQMYRDYIHDSVRLRQRLATRSNPSSPLPVGFTPDGHRSVGASTTDGSFVTLHEDGSITPQASDRVNPDGTEWRAPRTTDSMQPIYDDEQLGSMSNSDLFRDVQDRFYAWDESRNHDDEQLLANTLRIAQERTQQELAVLMDPEGRSLEIHKQRSLAAAALMSELDGMGAFSGDTADDDPGVYMSPEDPKYDPAKTPSKTAFENRIAALNAHRDRLELDRRNANKLANSVTYYQLFLGLTSPAAAGVGEADIRMTGEAGNIQVGNMHMNEISGSWTVRRDGSAILHNPDGTTINFTPEGDEL